MLSPALTILALAATAVADPTPPALTFLFSVNLTMPATVELGSVPYGTRGVISIDGGAFKGPRLQGVSVCPRQLCGIESRATC